MRNSVVTLKQALNELPQNTQTKWMIQLTNERRSERRLRIELQFSCTKWFNLFLPKHFSIAIRLTDKASHERHEFVGVGNYAKWHLMSFSPSVSRNVMEFPDEDEDAGDDDDCCWCWCRCGWFCVCIWSDDSEDESRVETWNWCSILSRDWHRSLRTETDRKRWDDAWRSRPSFWTISPFDATTSAGYSITWLRCAWSREQENIHRIMEFECMVWCVRENR